MPTPEIVLHGTELSGHCHRVELLLRMLGLPYRYEAAPAAVRGSPQFFELNPLRQIPVLQDGDLTLSDSNAILVYLAKRYAAGSHWLPEEPAAAAQVQRWLSIAAGEVRYGPAMARIVTLWNFPGDLARSQQIAHTLLRFMNEHLKTRRFLATEHATIADLACYSYVRHAPEGGIALGEYPSVLAWLSRIEALAQFKPIPPSPIPQSK
ncbi:MAG: glutathione S-transferase [Steroidobacteraceae bacterium]